MLRHFVLTVNVLVGVLCPILAPRVAVSLVASEDVVDLWTEDEVVVDFRTFSLDEEETGADGWQAELVVRQERRPGAGGGLDDRMVFGGNKWNQLNDASDDVNARTTTKDVK